METIIGLLAFVLVRFLYKDYRKFEKSLNFRTYNKQCTGVVTELIDITPSVSRKKLNLALVKYTIDDVDYHIETLDKSRFYKVGQKRNVEYNEKTPEVAIVRSMTLNQFKMAIKMLVMFFLIIAAAWLIISVNFLAE